jgi:hypothetical protein
MAIDYYIQDRAKQLSSYPQPYYRSFAPVQNAGKGCRLEFRRLGFGNFAGWEFCRL